MKQEHSNSGLFWKNNIGLAFGLFSVAFIATRLLGVAAGDPETAYAILQAQGTGAVVVGSLIPAVGLIAAPIAVGACAYLLIDLFRQPEKSRTLPALAIMLSSGLTAFFTGPANVLNQIPKVFVLLISSTALLRSVVMIVKDVINEKPLEEHMKPELHRLVDLFRFNFMELGLAYGAIILGLTALSVAPWLAPQNIFMKGHKEFSAYILSRNDQSTIILTRYPTGVVSIASKNIESTLTCTPSDYHSDQATLNEWFHSALSADKIIRYPTCHSSTFH